MRKVYCGGRFDFDCLEEGYRDKAAKDYRAVMLGGVALLLERSERVRISGGAEYIGPFYFETDGMQAGDIVAAELEMVRSCTDAVFLLDGAACPGTVCELTAASMMGKRVHIFYLRKPEGEETESELHTPCWYPILHSLAVNENTRIYGCAGVAEAVAKIKAMVMGW